MVVRINFTKMPRQKIRLGMYFVTFRGGNLISVPIIRLCNIEKST